MCSEARGVPGLGLRICVCVYKCMETGWKPSVINGL